MAKDGTMKVFRRGGMGLLTLALAACQTAVPPEETLTWHHLSQVLHVSPAGHDANAGTPQAPLQTLGAAASRAKPGTTVLLAAGTYHEQLVTRTAGTAEAPITFRSLDGRAIIDGSQLPWKAGGNQNQGLVELRHPYVRLEGLTITASKNTGVLLASDHLTVRDCEISQIQLHAISTETGRQEAAGQAMIRDIALEGNNVHHATLKGVGSAQAISLIAEDFVIRGNAVHDNLAEGIDIWLGSRRGEVVANTVYDNGRPGIYVDGASYVKIHGNRLFGNKDGIGISSEDERYETLHIWVYNNLITDHRDSGCFVWDLDQGVWEILFAHNTLIRNQRSFLFSGRDLSVKVMNNLGFATGSNLFDESQDSYIDLQRNVWLARIEGFMGPEDFRLMPGSPAIDRGRALPTLKDDRGTPLALDTDLSGLPRTANGVPDAGAYEFQPASP